MSVGCQLAFGVKAEEAGGANDGEAAGESMHSFVVALARNLTAFACIFPSISTLATAAEEWLVVFLNGDDPSTTSFLLGARGATGSRTVSWDSQKRSRLSTVRKYAHNTFGGSG